MFYPESAHYLVKRKRNDVNEVEVWKKFSTVLSEGKFWRGNLIQATEAYVKLEQVGEKYELFSWNF